MGDPDCAGVAQWTCGSNKWTLCSVTKPFSEKFNDTENACAYKKKVPTAAPTAAPTQADHYDFRQNQYCNGYQYKKKEPGEHGSCNKSNVRLGPRLCRRCTVDLWKQ